LIFSLQIKALFLFQGSALFTQSLDKLVSIGEIQMKIQSRLKSVLMTLIFTLALVSALPQATLAEPGHQSHPPMTDAQKKCFTAQGLTPPGEGERPKARPEQATMEKVGACLKENGMERPPHPPGPPRGPHGPKDKENDKHPGPPPGPPPADSGDEDASA
jgi:hypothetical protein